MGPYTLDRMDGRLTDPHTHIHTFIHIHTPKQINLTTTGLSARGDRVQGALPPQFAVCDRAQPQPTGPYLYMYTC